jgi:HD-GYP domain-containing protein (c-di-GMP phosphodiesterase class II)
VNLLNTPKYQFITENGRRKEPVLEAIKSINLNRLVFNELVWMEKYDYHYHHTIAVAAIVARLALDAFHEVTKAAEAVYCALTHDFGITRVPEAILGKITALHESEMKIIHEHPVYSYALLCYYGLHLPHKNASVGFEHHENLNETGYPMGIIPRHKITHFVQISDIFDALISARPYRPEHTREKALKIIKKEVQNGKLDSDCFNLLTKALQAENIIS